MKDLIDYFNKNHIADHKLKFIGTVDGVVHITLTPEGLNEPESIFVLPNVVKLECKLFELKICKGSK
jgi:hypothetical protein